MPNPLPTCFVTGPAGKIKINVKDLNHYEGRGYKKVAGSETHSKADEKISDKEATKDELKADDKSKDSKKTK